MRTVTDFLRRTPRGALVVGVLVLLLLGGLMTFVGGGQTRTVSAHFDRAVQLYTGSEVRILGVRVGEITAVVPEGRTVRVEMTYDDDYDVPADAQAVIVTPTLTADRFVQLTPAYTGGPELEDGATIEVEDTGTPVELDRIYRSLDDLTRALGPNGVNRDGTLDNVLGAGAKFLDGQGARANDTIVALSRAAETFGNSSGELFATVRALDEFTGALAANDAAVSSFMENLGGVSQQLAGEKEELRAALANLAAILDKVERFVRDNRTRLNQDLAELAEILGVLGDEKKTLETILDIAPSALGNLAVAFDPETDTIGSRLGFNGNVMDLDGQLCTLVQAGQLPSADQACEVFETLLEPIFAQPAVAAGRPQQPGNREVRHGSDPAAGDLAELMGGRA
jgi:phospholipid/cholesterol/gamma-HCH transport system substrate-binding protein